MKTTMSINQYKQYKNSELSLIDIKLQNIGINRNSVINKTLTDTTTYIIENKTLILTLTIILVGFVGTELALSSLAVNALDFKPELCQNLFSQNNSGVRGI
jgi:hypothetical protein